MDSFIQKTSESFANFLSQNDIKANSKTAFNYLISFGVELDSFNFDHNLDRIIKGYEKTFYFEKPDEGRAILAFDDLLAVNTEGKERFATIDKKVSQFKNNFINNWPELGINNIPVFLGGAKFIPEQPNDLWENFSDSYWFIPDNILLKQNGKYFYIHYSQISGKSNVENLIDRYGAKLKKILLYTAQPNETQPKVQSIKGNTPKEKKKWIATAKEAIKTLENDELSKVVLSRSVELKLSEELNLDYAVTKLREENKESYIFAFHSGQSTFLGASPEKLAKFEDYNIEIDALAGSIPRGKNTDDDLKFENELLNSHKDISEHKFVLDYIVKSVTKVVESIEYNPQPEVKKLKNIQHLCVNIKAKLNSSNSIFEILDVIYPTPAICGTPKEKAVSLIRKLEDYKRGMYSGIVGWLNFEGEGEFAVAIRSALLKGEKLTAFAGCGIVADSNAEKEYEESELKLKTILSLFEK
jgi:isochorismate synthases